MSARKKAKITSHLLHQAHLSLSVQMVGEKFAIDAYTSAQILVNRQPIGQKQGPCVKDSMKDQLLSLSEIKLTKMHSMVCMALLGRSSLRYGIYLFLAFKDCTTLQIYIF